MGLILCSISASADEPIDKKIAMSVICCHVHLWTFERPEDVYWGKKENKTLYLDYLVKDHRPIAELQDVSGVVVVQVGQFIPDNQWNLDVTAGNNGLYRGVKGDLSKVIASDEFKPLLDKLSKDKRYVEYRLSGRPEGMLSDAFFHDLN